jgi:4'-phosphopantetheinyl transferase
VTNAVHVWTIGIEPDAARASSLLECLSGDERVRAARLRSTDLRLRFIIAHGAMRSILSRYLGVAAEAIRVDTTPAGKPFLPGTALSFNLACSDEVALCALAANCQIGVDVERIRAMADADALVRSYFAPGEARAYAALPAVERTAAFFSTWTRKEAIVKAVGDGAQIPLERFEVDIRPSSTQPTIATDLPWIGWRLWSFDPLPGYAAAVACGSAVTTLERFNFDEDSLRLVEPHGAGRLGN